MPTGVSIKRWGKPSRYYSWGHPVENNCLPSEGLAALAAVWNEPDGLLFHNAKFDLDCAEVHLGLPIPPWQRIHDTMLMLFLDDPNQRRVDLKGAAQRILDMPPEERDTIADWLIKNQPIPFVRINNAKSGKSPAGKYIAYAPGGIVGAYAKGDTDRTEGLFKAIWPTLKKRKMLAAYERERKLLPILLDMERKGVRVDVGRLEKDVAQYTAVLEKVDPWIRKKLGKPTLNIDSDKDLVDALIKGGFAKAEDFGVTDGGQYKADKITLEAAINDKQLGSVLRYRGALSTCLVTFMRPWLRVALQNDGLIFTSWNQVKAQGMGARTGRLSSTPNFQNIPKLFKPLFAHEEADLPKAKRKGLPKVPFALPALPLVRSYVIPLFPDHVLVDRDYSQQEPRILAHFEASALMEQYKANPWIDYHDNAKEHIERLLKREFERTPIKNINLGIIYGQGIGSLAVKNEATVAETKQLKAAILTLYPGLGQMNRDMKTLAASNLPLITWGGREYYCEPPVMIGTHKQTFEYKMVNTLVQGSAADCTKEAIIRFYDVKQPDWYLYFNVHDQLTSSVPRSDLHKAQEVMRERMESVEFDVLILSEGKWSDQNWAALIDYDKKGKMVHGLR